MSARWTISGEEYAARFTTQPCCGHIAAVHSDPFQRCLSTAGMDPNEHCDCPRYKEHDQ